MIDGLWSKVNAAQEDNPKLLSRPAYVELERHVGQCGTVEFAQASVAVPFVGAATGALVIASAIRLASLQAKQTFDDWPTGSNNDSICGVDSEVGS